MFYELLIFDFEDPTKYDPKDFKTNDLHCHIVTFFEIGNGNKKKIMMSGKVGKFSKQNDIRRRYIFMMRIMYIKLQS